MSRLGFKSSVYHGDVRLGELDAIPVADQNFQFPNNEIRINHISQISERCPPLAILQTICSFSVRCKLESSSQVEQPHLINLHASCFHESKTTVVMVGDEEIHLVAMPSKQKKFPCFWCYAVPAGLYTPCVGLLNLRCLAIVFDLDETLIVANTMKSFEDRIEAFRLWTARETDPIRQSGMSGELKRYVDDRMLLKQYVENDSVVDNGKTYKVQMEEVPPLSENCEKMFRPVIRLVEKNIVLTRINPEIRDTSVLVRLRPAWDDLRSYLTAKGRKRFEVYVCTMAERDYALEMWRLLDPGAHLIAGKQLLNRVVCVKSGLRKSLLNVFQDRMCLPKMAMVIDDRAKVWEEKDQPRVHVVPAFTPYYAPQAEMASAVPVLCVARNVACNVRGYFFKEFDENLLRQIVEISYEDDVGNLPPAPDVSNYLMTEDAAFASNGNANGSTPFGEGMNGVEVERRLDKPDDKCAMDSAFNYMSSDSNLRADSSHVISSIPDSTGPVSSRNLLPSQKPGLLGAPIKRDLSGDRDYDMKRGLLAMKPGLDFRNQNLSEHLLGIVPTQMSSSLVKGQGGWLVDEDINKVNPYNQNSGFVQEADAAKLDKLRTQQNSLSHCTLGSAPTNSLSHGAQMKNEEVCVVNDMPKQSLPLTGVILSQNQSSTSNRDFQTEAGKGNVLSSPLYIGVLQEIARRCNSKVEFRSVVSTSKDLQFSVEVLFTGEKIGIGMGKTRKDAQLQAAENGLRSLAEKYVAYARPHSEAMDVDVDLDKVSHGTENGFLWDNVPPGVNDLQEEDGLPKERTSVAADEHDFTSKVVNQQGNKNAKFSELPRTDSSKRSKRELFHVLLDQSSSGQVENGHLLLE